MSCCDWSRYPTKIILSAETSCCTGQACWHLPHCSVLVLQESALKTYLFTYGNYYSSLSLEQLSTMFDMPQKKVGCGWDCCLPSVSKLAAAAKAACMTSTCRQPPVLQPYFMHHLPKKKPPVGHFTSALH